MNWKNWTLIHRIVAGVVFAYALVLYLLTVAPTASFWDSGEFIAIANRLQVSHPPGAPFYMLVGRFFSMFVPTAYVALSINLVSVLASALTVLLTHLIIVRLVQEWQGRPAAWTPQQHITALFGGAIGALTFAATDSFWFNAVEAEVYAMSMLFTAAVVWLIMRWSEQAEHEEAMLKGGQHPFGLSANRYLVLIAYLFGLAIGVHLLNLLAIFFIALIVFFTEFDLPEWTSGKRWLGIVAAGVVSMVIFVAIYPGVVQWLPSLIGWAPFFVLFSIIGLLAAAIYFTQQRGMQLGNLIALSAAMVLIGYSSYAVIFIRSAADPPIDENDPETVEAIVSYLKREQYGSTPLLRGATYDNQISRINTQDETSFPRRHSQEPMHWRVYAQYDSDWEFFWKYQVGHMYLRYFLWNFSGKADDTQDAPAITGISFLDPDVGDEAIMQTPSERAGRNAYLALPLLLGLLGMAFHFLRDWKRAFSVLILFLVTGLGIIIYLNQPPMQPRERDYSYVASFFAFSLWIGIGATGLLELAVEAIRERKELALKAQRGALLGLGGLLFAVVPLWMATENYDDHDRSGRYVAPEYARNMLMSLEENAIVFTNGDNDTFPLWYLQEVERVRTDVRVVNLSLLNTPWYIKQLKNQSSRESAPLPISLSDEQIDNLGFQQWTPREVALPVDKEKLLGDSEVYVPSEDADLIESPMRWTLQGRRLSENMSYLYTADLVAYDILRTAAQQGWERPVYFAVTVSRDGQLDLQNYFQLEGQAFRVVPIRHEEGQLGRVVPEITLDHLSKFKFTNVADPDVYYDENIRRMMDNYRNIYAHTAMELSEDGQEAAADTLLDRLMTEIPFETIPADERSFLLIAQAYQSAGNKERAVQIMKQAEPLVLARLTGAKTSRDADFAAQYVQMVRYTYLDAGDYEAASAFSDRLADALDDESYRQTPEEIERRLREGALPDGSTSEN